jgi:hypothetical protein
LSPKERRVVIVPQVALCSQASEYEHEHSQSFRFTCSTRHFGRSVVRDQLDWVGAARVLAAPQILVEKAELARER